MSGVWRSAARRGAAISAVAAEHKDVCDARAAGCLAWRHVALHVRRSRSLGPVAIAGSRTSAPNSRGTARRASRFAAADLDGGEGSSSHGELSSRHHLAQDPTTVISEAKTARRQLIARLDGA